MAKVSCDYISVFDLACQLSSLNENFSLRKLKCRKDFITFLDNSKYFGVQKFEASDIDANAVENFFISKLDADKIKPNIELWLRSYGVGDDEKLELLMERMAVLYPVTGDLFSGFINYSQACSAAAWKLADYLCFALCGEITEMNNEKLECLAGKMDKELPLASARLFSEFLMYVGDNGGLSNSWVYNFNSRKETDPIVAYTVPDFLKMAYIVFNEESWKKQCLLEKALQSEKDANLWVFVALHFICGWRGTDIIRLPMPTLPFEGAKIREHLATGIFDAIGMINELEFRLNHAPLTPQKTGICENIPVLKLLVPESFRKPMGIVLATAASHHETVNPGGNFIRKDGDRKHIISFFGEDFINACGRRRFSSRRANKAYLQGIEIMADSSPGKPKGYMLAALARSHKGGFGTLPETTDIYLRDAKFSGYRPEFIAREMFERGVFSFIPSLMMEMYAKDSYTKLPIPVQTKILTEIGIEASGLEGLSKSVEVMLAKARSTISEIMKYPENIRGSVADILQNIASGNAPGKQEGFLCLMTASGLPCVDAMRSSCIGCGYEIYTKTILHCLSKEYARLISAKNSADSAESIRCTKILKEAVMPAITEMFVSIKRMYPDVDVTSLISTTEMGAMLC